MSVTPADLVGTLLRRAAAWRAADANDRDRCLTEVRRQVAVLRRELRFGRAWLIGSIAWGGFGVRSDVDLVVEAADGNVVHEVAERLGEATGRAVDVLAFETLPASFQSRILADGLDVA